MENCKLFVRDPTAKRTVIFIFSIATIAILFGITVLIMNEEYIRALLIPLFWLLPIPVFYLLRKKMFGKVRISNDGVAFIYKEQVAREIKWDELKRISIYSDEFVFSKNERPEKGMKYLKSAKQRITINLLRRAKDIKEFCQELKKHLPKLSFTIDSKTLQKIDNYSALANKKS